MATIEQYLKAINNKCQKRLVKIEWVKKINGEFYVYDSVIADIIQGNLTTSLKNGVRSNISLTLYNENGKYIPHEDSFIWLDKMFFVYTGIEVSENDFYWEKQGLFVLTNPVLSYSVQGENITQITANDYAQVLKNELEYDYVIPRNEVLSTAIRQIFKEAGITNTVFIDRELNDILVPINFIANVGQTFENLLTKIADLYIYEYYIDTNGLPQFKRPTIESSESSVKIFDNKNSSVKNINHTYNSENIYNVVKVIGRASGDIEVSYIAENKNILSPLCIQKIGRKVKVIEDSNIPSEELAKQRAKYELEKFSQMDESISLTAINDDTLKVGDIITLNFEKVGLKYNRFKITSISRTFGVENTMTIQATNAKLLQDTFRVVNDDESK